MYLLYRINHVADNLFWNYLRRSEFFASVNVDSEEESQEEVER